MFNLYEQYLNVNSRKTLILGEKGFLASRYKEWSGFRENKFDFLSLADITDDKEELFRKVCVADIVINTISETSVNSISPDIVRKQISLNAEWPELLAELSLEFKFKLVHISTSDLYDFNLNNTESSPVKFSTGYYYSKYLGEQLINKWTDSCLILRPRLLFDNRNAAKNLISKLNKYDSLYDSEQSVSSTDLVIAASLHLSEKNISGIVNICEKDAVNYPEIGFGAEEKKIIAAQSKIVKIDKLKDTGFQFQNKVFQKYYEQFR